MACGAVAGSAPADWAALAATHRTDSPQRAAACFADATLADPLALEPALARGLLALEDGAARRAPAEAAVPLLRRAARLALHHGNASGAAIALRALGDAHTMRATWKDAAAAFGHALSLEPADCLTSAKLADARWNGGELRAAATALRAALAEDHACPLAHHGLARILGHLDELPAALRHARAALELRPFDEEYDATLKRLLEAQGRGKRAALRAGGGTVSHGSAGGGGGEGGDTERTLPAAGASSECGANAEWRSPPAPSELAPAPGCTAARRRAMLLLVNPFEEGCFHDDLRSQTRQAYHSCGQFNNVLASLLHALALSKARHAHAPEDEHRCPPFTPRCMPPALAQGNQRVVVRMRRRSSAVPSSCRASLFASAAG
jgi:tetratricopeptide (TPR) repeat protein